MNTGRFRMSLWKTPRAAISSRVVAASANCATLCKGVATGRKGAAERTVFKSVGSALQDLAAAMLAVGPG